MAAPLVCSQSNALGSRRLILGVSESAAGRQLSAKARMGRNPQTGEAIKIKAKTVVRLRPAKALKTRF